MIIYVVVFSSKKYLNRVAEMLMIQAHEKHHGGVFFNIFYIFLFNVFDNQIIYIIGRPSLAKLFFQARAEGAEVTTT
jgi:hypothetical protein